MENKYLIVFTYKGHTDSGVFSSVEHFKKTFKGVIDDIYSPGEWHYDEESGAAVPD